jgi:serine/threonine protein kinase
MPPNSSCPDAVRLQQLLSGLVTDQEAAPLEEHLEHCAACLLTLRGLPADDTLHADPGSVRNSGELPAAGTGAVEDLIRQLKAMRPPGGAAGGPPSPEPGLQPAGAETYAFLAQPQHPDELGRLAAYRVLKLLGSGGMGFVFQAEDVQLKRHVALKVMRPEAASKPAARERFLREARAAARLKSDHVVSIHQVGEDNGVVFLAMEYLEGVSLEEWLVKGRRPTPAQAARIGRQIALGLAAAHAHGLIHRDVKPGNIWLESAQQGRVKLLDFGLARGAGDDHQLTQCGAVVGTPAYMAPEQARGEKVDARADLFSLGCVLYRLCTGRLPFPGDSTMSILTALAVDNPPPVRELNPDIPPALSELVMGLLSKGPASRPASAQAVADALLTVERGPSTHGAPTAMHSATRRGRRRWLLAAASGLLAMVGLVAGIVVIIRDKQGNEVSRVNVPEGGSADIRDDAKDDGEGKVQYLSDMQEFGVKVCAGRFDKDGELGYLAGNPPSRRILVNGKEFPHGLSMVPESNTYAGVKYTLAKKAQLFRASVALNDSAGASGRPPGDGRIPTAVTFQVLGDGKDLWSSKPVDVARRVQECKVDVTGVDVLELRVDCPGSGVNAQAVWLEPRILLK